MLIDGQGFRARAQERTAAARDRVQRVAASQDDAQLAKHRAAAVARLRAAVRDQPVPAGPVRPLRNPPRRSPPDADDLPGSRLR